MTPIPTITINVIENVTYDSYEPPRYPTYSADIFTSGTNLSNTPLQSVNEIFPEVCLLNIIWIAVVITLSSIISVVLKKFNHTSVPLKTILVFSAIPALITIVFVFYGIKETLRDPANDNAQFNLVYFASFLIISTVSFLLASLISRFISKKILMNPSPLPLHPDPPMV